MKKLITYFLFLAFAVPFYAALGLSIVFARGHHRQTPPPPPPVVVTPPPSGFSWGAFTGNSSVLGSWKGVFIGDGDSFTQDFGQYRVPLVVYWESSLTASQIQNGTADSYLKQWAAEMKAYGQPIIFAPLDEMNGNWNPYSGNPAAYKAAWIRIHGFFSASNVKFAYDPNNDSVPATSNNSLTAYYPGSSYVDLVGVDGFNFGGQTWSQVFSSALQALVQLNKPLWILSTGSVENQSQFIANTVAGAKQYGISGVIYFDYQQFTAPASTLQAL